MKEGADDTAYRLPRWLRTGIGAAVAVLIGMAPVNAAVHVVKPGESLSSIADAYGATVEQLLTLNDISNPHFIQVGDKIIVKDEVLVYTVQPGDTLTHIAQRFDMTVRELAMINNVQDANVLRPGQELLVSLNLMEHHIQRGETLSGIASQYGVTITSLVQLNGLADANHIAAGQRLVIPPMGGGALDPAVMNMVARIGRPGYRFDRWPTVGVISSNYGVRNGRMHHGTDFAAPHGTDIRAVRPGVVTYADSAGTYGLLVKIDHGNGVETRYAHASRLLVRPGESVRAGQVIAKVGSTGRSTGAHLHFEVRIDGESVNPITHLPPR